MKLISSFSKFMEDTVNLNPTRVEVADSSIDTMTDILKNNDLFGDHFMGTKPQGSIRQRTIIKPVKPDADFDVDLLFELEPFDEWEPKDYLLKLANEFRAMDRYKDKVDTRGKNRCVTIDYESDFHVDIVPAIRTSDGYVIMNKKTNQYELTDGDGYANWFERKSRIVGGNYLASVVRLMKYIRDSQEAFEAKSILLTTLVGHQVLDSDVQASDYPDLPTAFLTILSRLDQVLQANPVMPNIDNPVLPGENFNRHWDQEKYERFREQIHEYAELSREAYEESDEEASLEKWREVFGEVFPLYKEDVGEVTPAATSFPLGNISHCQPVASIPGCTQVRIDPTLYVRINGYLYSRDGRTLFRGINSDASISSNRGLKYEASTNAREPYEVYWQVVNTGPHAESIGSLALRGDFFHAKAHSGGRSSNKNINWERSEYTGKHWIECFVLKDGTCVARSGRFYINIKNPSY